jgi:hypothetical protein
MPQNFTMDGTQMRQLGESGEFSRIGVLCAGGIKNFVITNTILFSGGMIPDYIRLVQQHGWLSHKSCKKRKFLTKFTFFAFLKRLLFKNFSF